MLWSNISDGCSVGSQSIVFVLFQVAFLYVPELRVDRAHCVSHLLVLGIKRLRVHGRPAFILYEDV